MEDLWSVGERSILGKHSSAGTEKSSKIWSSPGSRAGDLARSRDAFLTETELSITALRIVLASCAGTEEAERIAHALVESQAAACVTLVPGARSLYRWEGKVESANEVLLLIKTEFAQIGRVQELIVRLHSYDVPEFLVLDISGVSEPYLAWLTSSLKKG
jgi:periplasmic divalent cation tolerance protein